MRYGFVFRNQSAISQQIKNLEEELGCKLIERIGKRKLRLTSAGNRFFKFSETILERHFSLIVMESSNVELSSLYVEMGFGISFATVVKDLPKLTKRKLEFLPMDHLFKPDYIVMVMRKDKT